jgi:tRNA(fMet)-specific endonuclease VapC
LTEKLRFSTDPRSAITVITFEEQMRGWLAEIRLRRQVHQQAPVYERLPTFMDLFRRWEIILFDARAADEFERLRRARVRIGTQDLKIAAIALVHDGLLLSANLKDFRKVPELRVENWLI